MTKPIPSAEDLARLAEAALSNAEALLDDALLLAEAGRFPRAYALATLACEEVGKSFHCVSAIRAISFEKFWNRFNNHRLKLEPGYVNSILTSGVPIESERVFTSRVREISRAAHLRKLDGFYVGFSDGMIRTPDEITEQEALAIISEARSLIDRKRASLSADVANAKTEAARDPMFRIVFTLFIGWLIVTDIDAALSMLREESWTPELTDLLLKFRRHVEDVGLEACAAEIREQIS